MLMFLHRKRSKTVHKYGWGQWKTGWQVCVLKLPIEESRHMFIENKSFCHFRPLKIGFQLMDESSIVHDHVPRLGIKFRTQAAEIFLSFIDT